MIFNIAFVSCGVLRDEKLNEPSQLNPNQFRLESMDVVASEIKLRPRRALIFRPLFVYKEQEIRRKKIKEEREKRKQQAQG